MLALLSFGIASFIGTSLSSFILKRSVKLALAGAPLILAVSALVLTLWEAIKSLLPAWRLSGANFCIGSRRLVNVAITRSLADQAEKAGSYSGACYSAC